MAKPLSPVPVGTTIVMLRSVAGLKKGKTYPVVSNRNGNTVLATGDIVQTYLGGPGAVYQYRKGTTWDFA